MEKRIRSIELADAQTVREIYAPFVSDNATSFEVVVPDLAEVERRIRTQRGRYPWLVFETVRDRPQDSGLRLCVGTPLCSAKTQPAPIRAICRPMPMRSDAPPGCV